LEGQEQLLFGRIGEVQRAGAPQKRPSEMKNVGLATTAGQERQRRGVPSLDQDVDRLNERLELNLALFLQPIELIFQKYEVRQHLHYDHEVEIVRLVLRVLGLVYEVEKQRDVLETVQETDVHELSQVNEQVLRLD